MSDYPMLISNKLHSFRNFDIQKCPGTFMILVPGHFVYLVNGKILFRYTLQPFYH